MRAWPWPRATGCASSTPTTGSRRRRSPGRSTSPARRPQLPDPRVPGAPARYAAGAPTDALPSHELYYVLWSAARGIAAGGDGLSTAALLRRPVDVDFEPGTIGELMAVGMADMLACR